MSEPLNVARCAVTNGTARIRSAVTAAESCPAVMLRRKRRDIISVAQLEHT